MLNSIVRRLWTLWGNRLSKSFIQRNDGEYGYQRRFDDPLCLERHGYKVFSQNDEDGIIAEIFRRIGDGGKVFVEFGVQNGLECNSHYLLHKGWSGLWMEGSPKYCKQIRKLFRIPVGSGQLRVVNAFIDRDNINDLIKAHAGSEVDLLSIDIDGNDYWVWEAITCVKPRVVVIEYNPKFPPDFEWVMEYDKNHIWNRDDRCGASLKSLETLGRKLGYQLVGTNRKGLNAFFVRQDAANGLFAQPATSENLYNPQRLNIHYVSGHPSREYTGSAASAARVS